MENNGDDGKSAQPTIVIDVKREVDIVDHHMDVVDEDDHLEDELDDDEEDEHRLMIDDESQNAQASDLTQDEPDDDEEQVLLDRLPRPVNELNCRQARTFLVKLLRTANGGMNPHYGNPDMKPPFWPGNKLNSVAASSSRLSANIYFTRPIDYVMRSAI